jgi:phage terminase small subunit
MAKAAKRGGKNANRPRLAIPRRDLESVTQAISQQALAELTPRRQLFVGEYLVDLNGTQAAIRAGYSVDSARSIASENLTKPNILAAVDQALMELGGVTRARLVQELAAIAFSDIRQAVTWSEMDHFVEPGDTYYVNGAEHVAKEDGVTHVVRQRVNLADPTQMDETVARCIAEVSQTDKGSVKSEDQIARQARCPRQACKSARHVRRRCERR